MYKSEWQQFLSIFNSSDRASALGFASKMKDLENKQTALRFLNPSKAEKAAGKKRMEKLSKDKTIQKDIDLMVNSKGFLG